MCFLGVKGGNDVTLATMKKGECAIITEFTDLSESFSRRLYDVGISVGSEVRLLSILNFGQLFYISIDDVDLCIRKQEAQKIKIEKI